ncbi:hypothetical protein Mal64_23900 [Pseudobythopirellula maris]|uniref:Uncharacterized protein n=1 Tax=Pseudobythopirellula maris TaxID=2527991 RepID=A0A5C5ZNY2_9BACT|nr:hypothetical protein [Pseudobythopirellula maris]TWT88900.1 hypothetical protein Mal64_23900 [Pseudobythopirellula maris]
MLTAFRLLIARHRIARRAAAALMAAAYVVAATGVSLSLPQSPPFGPAKSAERFPCESCACGCATAEACWTRCCCHTPAERLAWAEREGVTPPARILAQLTRSVAESLAATKPKPACCAKSCCSRKTEAAALPATKRYSAFSALACQGLSQHWLAVAPAPPPAAVELPVAPDTQRVSLFSPAAEGAPASAPPVPPPRGRISHA